MIDAYRMRARLALLALDDLVPHEQTLSQRLSEVLVSIRVSETIFKPVIVDSRSHVIIDGHHRVESLRILGARYAPVVLVDYEQDITRIHATRPLPGGDPYRGLEVMARSLLRGFRSGPHIPFSSRQPLLEPQAIVEVAEKIGVLPPKSTRHVTWAKSLRAPISLHALY